MKTCGTWKYQKKKPISGIQLENYCTILTEKNLNSDTTTLQKEIDVKIGLVQLMRHNSQEISIYIIFFITLRVGQMQLRERGLN